MNSSIAPALVPPARGLEKEEPELWEEEDIPSDSRTGVDDDWQSPIRKDDRA